MSNILEIANGVADCLAEYKAEVMFSPEFELRKMQDMRVVVLPVGKERKFLTRSSFDNGDSIDVAVIHKCRDEAAVADLISMVEGIGASLLNLRIGMSICKRVKWEPLFSVDELRGKGLFISVIQLFFQEMGL